MTAPALDFRNGNTLWASVIVEALARCGLRQAVICPGSRSAPLALAFAGHEKIEAISALDERSAGFFALGLAKRRYRPVVLVCTSGTAVANFLPAIIEASESSTPLLVLTADRPPELRDCGSGQTIDQQKLYGGYVRFFHEIAVPEPRIELLRYVRQTVAHAWQSAQTPEAGPVHLNCPFRDPLHPAGEAAILQLSAEIDDDFFSHLGEEHPAEVRISVRQRPTTVRGLIVAGPSAVRDPAAYVAALERLAGTLRWPVLADALSPARHHAMKDVVVISAYDALLRNRALARDLTPRYVLCLGSWPTSKVLRAWLAQSQAEVLLVSPSARNRDALHGRTRSLQVAVENLVADAPGSADDSFREAWRAAEAAAQAALEQQLGDREELFEGKAAWLLSQHLPEGTPVFVASSMPVRDVEWFWQASDRRTPIFFNRGANGIDGTLSTALGIAHGNRPAVLLTGDLALLHDSNGFLIGPKLQGSLTIVLINNQGGGIFEHLPIAQFNPPFEEFFAAPQAVDFAALCAAYGAEHVLVSDWAQFISLTQALPTTGIRVLELRTDRKRDAAVRKSLFAAVAEAVERR